MQKIFRIISVILLTILSIIIIIIDNIPMYLSVLYGMVIGFVLYSYIGYGVVEIKDITERKKLYEDYQKLLDNQIKLHNKIIEMEKNNE